MAEPTNAFVSAIPFSTTMSEYKPVKEWPALVLELLNESDDRLFVQEVQFRQAAPDVPIFAYAPFVRKSELDALRQRVTAAPVLRLIADMPVIPAKQFFAAAAALRARNLGIGMARGEESSQLSYDKQFLSAVLQTLHFVFWDALLGVSDINDSCGTIAFAVDEENREASTRTPLRGLVVAKFKRSSSESDSATFSVFLIRARAIYPAEEDLDIFTLETQPDFLNPLRDGSRNAIRTISLVRSRQPREAAVMIADKPYSAMSVREFAAYSTGHAHDVLSTDIALVLLDMKVKLADSASVKVQRTLQRERQSFLSRARMIQTVVAQFSSTSFSTKNDAIDAVLVVTQQFRDVIASEPRHKILRSQLPYAAVNNQFIASNAIIAATQIAYKLGAPQLEQGIIDITVQLPMTRYEGRWPEQLFYNFMFCNLERIRFRVVRKLVQLFPQIRAFLEQFSTDNLYATFIRFLGDRDTGFDYDPTALF